MGRHGKLLVAVAAFLIFFVQFAVCIAAGCTESITSVSGPYAPRGEICSGQLIFKDEFDKFDLRRWQHEITLQGGGNWEFQWYTNNRSVSYVENGKLHIKPSFVSEEFGENFLYSGTVDLNGGTLYETCTNARDFGCSRTGNQNNILNPIKSARIRTVYSFAFTYGKIEVRAKIPTGDWLWPAIWLMPKYAQYGTWPASGEIDIMESRGNSDLISSSNVNIGNQMVASTLHFGPRWDKDIWNAAHFEKSNKKGYNSSFHKYQLEWTDSHLKFLVDDVEIGTTTPPNGGFWQLGGLNNSGVENPWKNSGKMAPFDQDFYIIINLAVGGTNYYFPDDATNGNGAKPWKNTSPTAYKDFWEGRSSWEPTWNRQTDDSHFQIDYVKVWAI